MENRKLKIIIEVFFWLGCAALLATSITSIVFSEIKANEHFTKAMSYVTTLLAAIQAPLTLLKIRGLTLQFLKNIFHKQERKAYKQKKLEEKREVERIKFEKQQEKKRAIIEKELKKQIIRQNPDNELYVEIRSEMKSRGIVLNDEELYEIVKILRQENYEILENYIYSFSYKKVDVEFLIRIKNKFKNSL